MGGKNKKGKKQQVDQPAAAPKKEEEKAQEPAAKTEVKKQEAKEPVKKVEEKKASEIEKEKQENNSKDVSKEKKVEEAKTQQHGDELNTIIQNPGSDGWGQQTKQQQFEDLEMQQRLQEILKLSQILQNNQGRLDPRQRKQIERRIKLLKPHAFWDNQPVKNMKNLSKQLKEGPIEVKVKKDVSSEPSPLPAGFEWCTIDLENDDDAEQVYTLLKEHYVEDSEGVFRFEYSVDLIRWVLCGPDHNKEWHVGLRNSKSKKLLGFISGTPCKVNVKANNVKMAEINFLCVNRKL